MQTQPSIPTRQMPNQLVRLSLGMLVLLLTLLLIVTAVDPQFDNVFLDETCRDEAERSFAEFSAETAVPDCWLVQ